MKIAYATLALTIASLSTVAGADVFTQTFDTAGDITLGASQASGTWYTDRFAPAVFESGVMFDGSARLHQGISSADSEANRPSGFDIPFYNYQGRKFDVNSGTNSSVSIDLFVDSAWNAGTRAGMWTTMSNGNLTFPIIEYVVDGDNGDSMSYTGFRYWQSNIGWTATSFANAAQDEWYTLDIELTATTVEFSINGTNIGSVGNLGAHMIDNVILNAHNQGPAGSYDVYWDNFNAVPTPGSFALLGLGGLVATRRRRA